MRPSLSAIALGLGVLLLAALLAITPAVQRWNGDIRLFEHYAGLTFSGHLGRTAFLSWYPPFSLVPLGLPLLAGSGPAYVFALAAEMAVVAGVGLLLLRRFGERLGAAAGAGAAYAALVLAMAVVVAWRYDIVASVAGLAALAALVSRRWTIAGVLIGISAGLKIYALLLVPLLVLWAWRYAGRTQAARMVVAVGVVGVVAVGAYLLFPGSSPFELLAFTSTRPLHVESLSGALIALVTSVGGGTVSLAYDSGSFNVVSPAAAPAIDVLRIAQPAVLAGTLFVAGLAIWRNAAARQLVVACAAVLLALIVTNRVLSPQYLLWLLPFAALAGGWARWLLAAALTVTALIFPWFYSSLIVGDSLPLALVAARNGLLVAAWVATLGVLASPSLARAGVGRAAPTVGHG